MQAVALSTRLDEPVYGMVGRPPSVIQKGCTVLKLRPHLDISLILYDHLNAY